MSDPREDPDFTTKQLITYIGNKRALAAPLDQAVREVRARLGGRKVRALDLFSGSGFVSRLLKQHSTLVAANDLESYARVVSECYLTDHDPDLLAEAARHVDRLNTAAAGGARRDGFVQELYAPADDGDIQSGERVFYSNDNARRLDFYVQEIAELPPRLRTPLLAPLLAKASVHANTGGVFKGFYKDKATGLGKFGAAAGESIGRILAPITLEVPVTSNFTSGSEVFCEDATTLVERLDEYDLAYLDPPYNQHPYGSNYFMLNLLADCRRPEAISPVSGIPADWNRSGFNVRSKSPGLLEHLFGSVPARFLLVSFNSEGHVPTDAVKEALARHGRVEEVVWRHNTYRASRNLAGRSKHVNEHLFLMDRGA